MLRRRVKRKEPTGYTCFIPLEFAFMLIVGFAFTTPCRSVTRIGLKEFHSDDEAEIYKRTQ